MLKGATGLIGSAEKRTGVSVANGRMHAADMRKITSIHLLRKTRIARRPYAIAQPKPKMQATVGERDEAVTATTSLNASAYVLPAKR